MASQTVSPEKRYRMSLLLDAYGDLLTEKQRTFMRRYYEEDLTFGEIAADFGVSRQAIFDSVKHGEAALENYERVVGLIENGFVNGKLAQETALEIQNVAEMVGGLLDSNGEIDSGHMNHVAPVLREASSILERAAYNLSEGHVLTEGSESGESTESQAAPPSEIEANPATATIDDSPGVGSFFSGGPEVD